MPKLKFGEKRSSYVARAIPELMKEGLSRKQAVDRAEGMFTYYTKHRGKYSAKKK